MSFLENRIPPPIVLLLSLILIRLVANADELVSLPFAMRLLGAGILLTVGVSLAITGVRSFKKAETTINPLNPASTSSLVTGGIYQYTRNPMYLGMLLVAIGASVYFSSVMSLGIVAGFYWFITRFQILPEERAMQQLFGEQFTRYQQQVRRWL